MPDADAYPSLWKLRHVRSDPIGFLRRQAERGDIADFRLRSQPVYLLSHPSLIEEVLVAEGDKFRKSPALQRASRLLGRSLLTLESPVHAERRKIVQPAFHRPRLEGYADLMVAHAVRTRDGWADGQTIDMSASMTSLALAIVGETLFGTSLAPHARTLGRVLASALASLDPLVALVAARTPLGLARERLLEIVANIVRERRSTGGAGDDLLGMLLAANAVNGSDEQLYDDVLTMLLAGHDTIANAMTWAWTALATHSVAQERLAGEVESVLGNRLPGVADVPQLVYARAVMSEALRLRPPAWIIARRAIDTVAIGGAIIPRDAIVLMSAYLVQRDARFFHDPLAFRPERWLDGEVKTRPKLAFFPFGAGRRSCIGESFAWMEGVLVLATLVQRWRFEAAGEPGAVELRITMRPRGPVPMVCRSRATPVVASGGDAGRRVAAEVRRVLRQRVPSVGHVGDIEDAVEFGAAGLGLDSVAVVELLLECELVFGVRLPSDAIDFGQLTVGGLVEIVEAAIREPTDRRTGQ